MVDARQRLKGAVDPVADRKLEASAISDRRVSSRRRPLSRTLCPASRVVHAVGASKGCPAVATFHRSGDGPALTYSRPILERLGSRIDVAVSVSETAAATIRRAAGIDSEVLFNGFEVDRFVA
jgi:hypothetical protein